jgi:lipopolysaccharide export system protein LptC
MSLEANQMRDKRQEFAKPGGTLDRIVGVLGKALPAGIGLVAAIMVLAPLGPRGEVSFLLDRNKVAVTNDRVKVDDAAYRGEDADGRDFVVTAGDAVQRSAAVPVIAMNRLRAQLAMRDGPARIIAPDAAYDYRQNRIAVNGPVNFSAADGYRMTTQNVAVDLRQKIATGSGGVSGTVPSGTFTADRLVADLEDRTVTLEGNARLRMVPGEFRMPQ